MVNFGHFGNVLVCALFCVKYDVAVIHGSNNNLDITAVTQISFVTTQSASCGSAGDNRVIVHTDRTIAMNTSLSLFTG